jgi:hypothetical protein
MTCKTNAKTTSFTLEHKLCDANPNSAIPNEIWSAVFSFDAKDEQDAQSKVNGWARYQGFDLRDVRYRTSTENEAKNWKHNEYIH